MAITTISQGQGAITLSTENMPQPNQVFRVVSSQASTNSALIKPSSGGVASISGYNTASQSRYLKLYNLSAVPNVGTDAPFWSLYLPSQSEFDADFGGSPLLFSNGIGVAMTVGPEDVDRTPIGGGEIMSLAITYY